MGDSYISWHPSSQSQTPNCSRNWKSYRKQELKERWGSRLRENLCELQQHLAPYTTLSEVRRLCFIFTFLIWYKMSLWPTPTQNYTRKEILEISRWVKLTLNKSTMLVNADHVFSVRKSLFFQSTWCTIFRKEPSLCGVHVPSGYVGTTSRPSGVRILISGISAGAVRSTFFFT